MNKTFVNHECIGTGEYCIRGHSNIWIRPDINKLLLIITYQDLYKINNYNI